ncbi:MAG: electron transfer flavoprotein subunit alpha/FixB family protein [Actinobacteria bacterium]|nr:electron transfer flavoprotein subunit alpha/FixB family protein [Actinomycetota bacterium]
MTDVLVLVDHDHGEPRKVSRQLLSAAREVCGGPVHAVVLGAGARDSAERLGAHGVTTVYTWDAEEADRYVTETRTAALCAAIERSGARVVLFPADPFLTDVAARAAVRLGAGIITDAVGLERDGDAVVATKAIFGGEMTSRCTVRGERPELVGVKANAFDASESGGAAPELVELDVPLPGQAARAEVVEVVEEAGGERPEMTEATIIVAGGRGLGEADGFGLVERLADSLGGAVGASRAATDAGWYPHQHQIGQTGKTVAPQLYVGLGISGAIQHRAGMQTSQTIVVVNKDAEAPIFSIADFGVVGDLHAVVPQLVAEIDKRRA